MSSGKCRPFCLGLSVLTVLIKTNGPQDSYKPRQDDGETQDAYSKKQTSYH